MIPPDDIPILSRVKVSFNSKITLLSAFGFKVLSGENSKPWSETLVSLALPISSVSTDKTAFTPVVVPIEVIIGSLSTLIPSLKTFTEYIPPISPVELVE